MGELVVTLEERAAEVWMLAGADGDPALILDALRAAVAEDREAALVATRDYLSCVPCPPMCSIGSIGLHVDYCARKVAEEPGFANSIRARTP